MLSSFIHRTSHYYYYYYYYPINRNGPDGSVLCVYTFDNEMNDLDGVFKHEYLEQMGASNWVEVSNDNPVTVSCVTLMLHTLLFYIMPFLNSFATTVHCTSRSV